MDYTKAVKACQYYYKYHFTQPKILLTDKSINPPGVSLSLSSLIHLANDNTKLAPAESPIIITLLGGTFLPSLLIKLSYTYRLSLIFSILDSKL